MMADELLNAQDLITAKKHDTFHSEVITGKAGGLSTGANIDYATNAVTAQVQKTLPKILDDLDWSYVGLFADGVTFTDKTDFAVDAVGTQWIYTGSLPFTATAGTVPSEPTYQVVHVRSADATSNANGGSVQDFIDAQYTTAAELATGKFQSGQYVRLTDRAMGVFLIGSGGAPDGRGVLDAGNGNTASPAEDEIHVENFGAVAGLSSENHLSIGDAIRDGRPLSWGSKHFIVTEPIGAGELLEHAINWKSNGAKITLDTASPQIQAVVWFEVGGLDHRQEGKLTVDASLKSNRGWWFEYKSTVHSGSFVTDGLSATNIRRTLDFSGGDGIIIEGGFKSVSVANPIVDNVRMASGAGISGSQGVAGVSIVRDLVGTYPLYMEVVNPTISNVLSEDLSYQMDQDGVRLFGGIESGDEPSYALVRGGTFKNCYGRSVKVQATDGLVIGTTFKRDAGLVTGSGNNEIDFLYGGGAFENIQCVYDGYVPSAVFANASSNVDNIPMSMSRGAKVTLRGGVQLPKFFDIFARKNEMGNPIISDVDIFGVSVGEFGVIRVSDDTSVVSLSRMFANVADQGFSVLANTGSSQTCTVFADTLVNKGVAVPLYRHKVAGVVSQAYVSAINCFKGWVSSGVAWDSTLTSAPIISVIPKMQGNYIRGGALSMESARVSANTEALIPITATSGAALVMINVAGLDTLNAIASVSASGVTLLSGGSGFTVGGTSNPGTGTYRLWVSNGNLVFYHTSGIRAITVAILAG